MMRHVLVAVAAAAVGLLAVTAPAAAGGDKPGYRATKSAKPVYRKAPKRRAYYAKGPRVRGYLVRRGGYSYTYADSLNLYGNSSTVYGGTTVYRDPLVDKQSGPFDHGYFFDSGSMPRGGDSPYMN